MLQRSPADQQVEARPDTGPTGGGAPLTRRALREARQAALAAGLELSDADVLIAAQGAGPVVPARSVSSPDLTDTSVLHLVDTSQEASAPIDTAGLGDVPEPADRPASVSHPVLHFAPVPQAPVRPAQGEPAPVRAAQAEGAPLTRRALREQEKSTRPAASSRSVRRPPAPRPGVTARRHAVDAKQEVLDDIGLFARKSLRPMGAVAAAAIAATMVQVGMPGARDAGPVEATDPEINALTPLRDMVEQVVQRGVLEQASRSSLVRTVALSRDADFDIARRSNSTITLSWANPKLTDGDTVVVRRTEGSQPAETVKDGVDVPLDDPQASELVDQGLTPESEYSYAVFVKRADAKPQIVATQTATTRLNPTELRAGDSLVPGEKLVSENGRYSLELDDTGELYLANETGLRMWSPAPGGDSLVQDSSGSLVLTDSGSPVWSTPAGAPGAVARLTNRGDVQVLDGEDVVWRRGQVGSVILGDDYPFSRGSPLGYSPNNCTDFAAWRLNRLAGITEGPWKFSHRSMTPSGGNAVQWVNYFPDKTDNTPALGAVAWWGSNTGRGRGHVAIVSAIREDGSIVIEEYNFYNRGNYGTRVLRPGGSGWPTKFIHINDL